MSQEYKGQDPIDIAKQAEKDLNSAAAKDGHRVDDNSRKAHGASDSTMESGVDESVKDKFPGAEVKFGSGATGAGDNREIDLDEGGSINPNTGQLHKAKDFEGVGGPEDKAELEKQTNPGSDDVRSNVREHYREG